MVNVIAESDVLDMVEVSYSDVGKYQNEKGRFSKADVVFLSTLGLNEKLIMMFNHIVMAGQSYILLERRTSEKIMDKFTAIVILMIIIV